MGFDLEIINSEIRDIVSRGRSQDENIGEISDGYHTFNELYEHRINLFRLIGQMIKKIEGEWNHFNSRENVPWKSRYHSDGSFIDGWFIAGLFNEEGEQITYHIPLLEWERFDSFRILSQAPKWDGHTSADVLKRLSEL